MPISPTVYTYPIITSHTKHAWEYNVIYEWSLPYLGGGTGGLSMLSPMVLKSGCGMTGDSGGVL